MQSSRCHLIPLPSTPHSCLPLPLVASRSERHLNHSFNSEFLRISCHTNIGRHREIDHSSLLSNLLTLSPFSPPYIDFASSFFRFEFDFERRREDKAQDRLFHSHSVVFPVLSFMIFTFLFYSLLVYFLLHTLAEYRRTQASVFTIFAVHPILSCASFIITNPS